MTLPTVAADLEGRVFGPEPVRWCREKVSEFVVATGDAPDLWVDEAPPGMAAAALFVVAAPLLSLLSDASVVHGEQTFSWRKPLVVETDHEVVGQVTRLRERGGVSFVTFGLTVSGPEGVVVEGRSTFLVSPAGPAEADVSPGVEPAPAGRGSFEPLEERPVVGDFGPLARSASRIDLVRYAGATRDWNPIHWDHAAAVAAGLAGVVCHGLLQVAWMLQPFTSPGAAPVAGGRFRFRRPLLAGAQAYLSGSGDGEVTLGDDDGPFVTGVVTR